MAKNKVIAGEYEGCEITTNLSGTLSVIKGVFSSVPLDTDNVEEYELLDETKRKSAVSAVGRAFVGGLILGPVGWLAGLSAKSKGIHVVAIEFKDGNRSLLQLNDKFYKKFIKQMF
ncbi:hypothetical protein [Bacillus sp. B-jedd]|uniref:hypothetical protein n=1 Tax=Bacillus sp. B-jedd TaxID=1476857 RepID=UPI00051560DA|nr:hypothetical protein [Bacillus sp. B-jedd]CEG26027.1 hypothetical protein BN1002_00865 [Bacillus sp. B-jedd]